jgi:hypothetical protein
MVTIDKTEIVADVYKSFFDLLSNQTNIPDTQTPARTKFWYAAWPDCMYSDTVTNETFKTSLPLGIIEVSLDNWDEFTLTKKTANVNIRVEWYTSSAENVDKYTDLIVKVIEQNRTQFCNDGLRFVNLRSATKDVAIRGSMKIHIARINFNGKVYFTKTRTW